MYPETRHKAIIALSFLIAVVWALSQNAPNPVAAGIVAFICAFPLLYALYYGFHVLGWVFFSGERGNGLRIIPRIWAGIHWAVRSIFHAIGNVILWLLRGAVFVTKAGRNAHERHQWEKTRPERERQAAEAARIEAERIEEERRKRQLAEDEEHRRRVAREAEVTEARTKAELAARLAMQDEANRQAREHEAQMLSIEQERLAIAERRAKRHDTLLGTLADLVEKSKG
jgi:flagellar biosynthesis GTPase FlhF